MRYINQELKDVRENRKLVIAASSKFQEQIKKWKEHFEKLGYEVINYPKKINQEDTEEYRKVYIEFFKSLDDTDNLFILNEEKNGIKGYIGAETFAELSYAMVQKVIHNRDKKVWILYNPSEEVKCYREIMNFMDLGWIELYKN